MSNYIHIDGSQGEGGGQILRTVLSLSALTGRAVRVTKVRAKRSRPGLLRQHLTAFRAVATICDGQVEGATLGSGELSLQPGSVRAGSYHFAVGTAGSACLVFQTLIWPLLFADGPSEVVFEGGTHNGKSPSFEFIAHTFVPLLRRMGAEVQVRIERHGFYPKGGGRFAAKIEPCAALRRLELMDGGDVRRREARALTSRLPAHIAERELAVVRRLAGWERFECHHHKVRSPGPGNALVLLLEREHVTETITAVGERGLAAEKVAEAAVHQLERYLQVGAPVGEYLADQLIIPLTLAGGGFRTVELSHHATTNIDVVAAMLGTRLSVDREADGVVRVRM